MSKTGAFIQAAACAVLANSIAQNAFAVENDDLSFNSTEDLFQVCSVTEGAAEYVPASFACRAFIEAMVQYHDEVSDRKHTKRLICYPKTATVEEGRQIFVTWAKKNMRNKKLMDE